MVLKRNAPDYRKIYMDILDKKFPDKKNECMKLLINKTILSELDIIKINNIIFGLPMKETQEFNQKHRSYSKHVILKILEYQKEYNLNNTQISIHFKVSRNTITKWRKIFIG